MSTEKFSPRVCRDQPRGNTDVAGCKDFSMAVDPDTFMVYAMSKREWIVISYSWNVCHKNKHTIFGCVAEGLEVLDIIN